MAETPTPAHGEWDKDQERYEDGCRSDAAPHVLGIPDEWKMPLPRLADDTPPAAPAWVNTVNLHTYAHPDALVVCIQHPQTGERFVLEHGTITPCPHEHPPARDQLAVLIQQTLSQHRYASPAAHADAIAKMVREQLAAELVPLLVDHTCCHDSRGYAAMCDCNHGPYNRDADGNRLKDEEPITRYAEHIASLVRRQQPPSGGGV